MMSIVHRFLLLLPPELAHAIAKSGLRLLQWVRFRLLRNRYQPPRVVIVDHVAPLSFAGRVGIAAGLDKDAQCFAGLVLLGAGFVEVGTVTPIPQKGNPRPRLWRVAPDTLVNHMGFNSCGLERFRRSIDRYRRLCPAPLLVNLGKNRGTPNESALEDYRKGFELLRDRADGFVVNLSSPNTPGLVSLQSEEFLAGLAAIVPSGARVWVKLSPDLENAQLEALGAFVRSENRFAGVVVTNTSREMAAEVFSMEQGGLSGRPLLSRALECVTLARQAVGTKKMVIGVGGVMDLSSARQMRRAGADLIEVYTGFVYRGPSLLKELSQLE